MIYSDARDKIQTGDVLLFDGRRGFFDWLIRRRTSSRHVHAGLAVWIRGRLTIVEATRTGAGDVRVYPLSRYVASGERIYWLRAPDTMRREAAARFALDQWGRRYASLPQFVRSFGIVYPTLAEWLGRPLDTHRHRWFCSELVAAALAVGGLPDPALKKPAQVAPGDLMYLPSMLPAGYLERDEAS